MGKIVRVMVCSEYEPFLDHSGSQMNNACTILDSENVQFAKKVWQTIPENIGTAAKRQIAFVKFIN